MQNQIPKNWQKVKLGEVVDITSSKRIFAREYLNNGIPFYRGKEIIEKFSGNDVSTDLCISQQKYDEIKNRFGVPQPGDMLLTSVGTLGVPYLVGEEEKFYFKDGNLTWFRRYSGINNIFLYYWILSPLGKGQLVKHIIGSSQQALTIDGLKKIDIDLPPINIQNQISSILSAFDDKIEINNKIAKTLEEMAQALFKEWFVNFRFPGYEKAEFVDSELGKIPKGWEIKNLADIADITIGRTPPREQSQWFRKNGEGKKWISIKDMGSSQTYIFNTAEQLTNEAIVKFNIPLIPKNTVVISFKLTLGRVIITSEEMTSNEAIAHISLKQDFGLYPEYIYMFMQRVNLADFGSTSSIGTAVNSKTVKGLPILVPNKIILNDSKKIIEPIFTHLRVIELENQQLTALRDLLLPKLMKGEIRV